MRQSFGPAAITLLYAAFGTIWIIWSDSMVQFLTAEPGLQSRLEIAKGLLFVAITSALLYFLLRHWAPPPADAGVVLGPDRSPRSESWRLALMLGLLVLTVPMIGFAVFALHARHSTEDTFSNLRVIADLKGGQIENWLAERHGDSRTLAASVGFVDAVAAIRQGTDQRQLELVRERLTVLRQVFAYDAIAVFDPRGRLLIAEGELEPLAEAEREHLLRAAPPGVVRMSDLHTGAQGRIYLDFVLPLAANADADLAAIVLLRVDPRRFLFPLIQSWPTASPSGETVLVRRAGDSIVYLNELRHRPGAALSLRVGLDQQHLPAAAAVRSAAAGVIQGTDYRGVPVLAAWRPVAGTPWYVVAKLDRDEALVSATELAWWISAITAFALAMVAIALVLLVRQQRLARELLLRVQADSLLRHFYDMPFVGMAIVAPTTHRWVRFNDCLCAISGYTREELNARGWVELVHPDDREELLFESERMLRGETDGTTKEARFVHKDGSVRVTNVDAKCVRKPDGRVDYLVAVIEDATERHAAQAKILRLNRLYRTLSQCNAAVVHCATEQELFEEICRATVEFGGMAMAWVGIVDSASSRVEAIASYGDTVGYLSELRLSVDANDPGGLGPTGTAIREGAPVWSDDFLHDPLTAPWRSRAERAGWRGSVALPLRRGALVVGALNIYVRQLNAFDHDTRALLLEIANAVSFGLASLGREAERKHATERLRESEQRYRLVVENSQDAILLTSADGRILAANAAAARIFECGVDELLTAGYQDIVDAADPMVVRAQEERARTGRFSGELTLVRRGGERFPADVSTALFEERGGARRASWIIRDITERKRAEDRLTYLAQHDVLTDLPNRLLLTDRLDVALARAKRAGKLLALMFIDLDRFKNVNDSLGHALGDQLLIMAAARLKHCVRAADTVSRQGGDEFLVVLPEIDRVQDAARVAEKLVGALSQPFDVGSNEVVLTASIGIACFPENGRDSATLLRNADAAMYAAKAAGRSRYQFYSDEMTARAHERLLLEADLRRAIEREQLFLVYQPQVDLRSGQVIGAEALVRWRHPVRGVIAPGEFIGIAEDSGLIEAIGAWVLETAGRRHAEWVRAGLLAGPVAVNVSARQFRQSEFVRMVESVLERTGLTASLLELELTESMVMHGVDEVLGKLESLNRLGVKLAIDDFGTGYSSLSYLKQFPIHRLKLDQSFTRGLPDDRESGAIANAVIGMGHSLGLSVLAEGVETEAQELHLRALGCDAVQGYRYTRPLPDEEFISYLRSRAQPTPMGRSSAVC